MLRLRDGIVELYKKAATSIPSDIEESIISQLKNETSQIAVNTLNIILENIRIARAEKKPVCQDTGVPYFYVKVPKCLGQQRIKDIIIDATRIATEKIPLRPNSVDIIFDKNTGDNTGLDFPLIHMEEIEDGNLEIALILKGGGSENIGITYRLPDESIGAERNLEGVKRCVMDAVLRAQGRACPPYIIGVAVGGSRDHVAYLSKLQLLRRLNDRNQIKELMDIEEDLLEKINSLGIGPCGFGGKTTCLSVKMAVSNRHPASYFVDVSFSCWALRRAKLIW